MTQDKKIRDEDFDLFKGRLFGCDTCQRVCPLNKFAQRSHIADFHPFPYMRDPDINEIMAMDNGQFKKYKATSSGWRGKKLLKRNAMIALASKGMEIREEFTDTEYLKDIRERLLKKYKL
jgi:epoxyqueuosine reductase QueG